MTKQRVRIGKINYANLFPIFRTLEKEFDCSAYEFVEGVPSDLNRMLRESELDVSPSSSIEYLRHADKYLLLDGHSVSSSGAIGSILFFSKIPIEELDASTALVSSQSETSTVLLAIILKEFYKLECKFRPDNKPLVKALESHPAYLLIGDEALIAKNALNNSKLADSRRAYAPTVGLSVTQPIVGRSTVPIAGADAGAQATEPTPGLYIYDLGEIWYKHTGLPFVFALWIAGKDFGNQNPLLLKQFIKDLDAAKMLAMKDLKAIAGVSQLRDIFSEAEIIDYWQGISYDLNDEHKKGLELFRRYAEELKLL